MEVEFMTADTTLPPCMPLPRAMLRFPISSTAKVMYARMLDIVFLSGIEDTNGILFIHFPIVELAAALARSTMTVKRSLNELEDAGLILRVRQGFGEPNKIYVLIPKKECWNFFGSIFLGRRECKWKKDKQWKSRKRENRFGSRAVSGHYWNCWNSRAWNRKKGM